MGFDRVLKRTTKKTGLILFTRVTKYNVLKNYMSSCPSPHLWADQIYQSDPLVTGHEYSQLSCPLVTFNNKATRSNLCVTMSMDRLAHVHILKTDMNIFYSLITLVTGNQAYQRLISFWPIKKNVFLSFSISTYFVQFNCQKRWACVDSNRLSENIDYLSRSGCYYACNNNVVLSICRIPD